MSLIYKSLEWNFMSSETLTWVWPAEWSHVCICTGFISQIYIMYKASYDCDNTVDVMQIMSMLLSLQRCQVGPEEDGQHEEEEAERSECGS